MISTSYFYKKRKVKIMRNTIISQLNNEARTYFWNMLSFVCLQNDYAKASEDTLDLIDALGKLEQNGRLRCRNIV